MARPSALSPPTPPQKRHDRHNHRQPNSRQTLGTAPVWRGDDHVSMVDLDLDVIRICDTGEVQIIDEDEFAEHSVLYDYPPNVSAAAVVAAEHVRSLMDAGHAPFDGSAERWLDLLPRAPA